MYLPPDLRAWRVELAGELLVGEDPGDRVKELRNRYGFTQKWLAEVLDMRRESLSRVESGHVNLSASFVRNFADVMTLARGVREHLAETELEGATPDDREIRRLVAALDVDPETGDAVVLESMINYGKKREEAIRDLGL